MRAVRTAGQQFANAKSHGRGRSPCPACRNAKQCKVCGDVCRAFLLGPARLSLMDRFVYGVALQPCPGRQ
ncbi:hypothetical protein BI313_12355 [Xanthomonas vesicatoria]|nr:hypothetical protein BI313_12355 [Xanthomonas vesicatoria]